MQSFTKSCELPLISDTCPVCLETISCGKRLSPLHTLDSVRPLLPQLGQNASQRDIQNALADENSLREVQDLFGNAMGLADDDEEEDYGVTAEAAAHLSAPKAAKAGGDQNPDPNANANHYQDPNPNPYHKPPNANPNPNAKPNSCVSLADEAAQNPKP